MSRTEMMEELNVKSKDTITHWRRDPRVKALLTKLNSDRAVQISSKVDSVIQGRLTHAKEMSVDELIKIRKEYGGPAARREEADSAVTEEAMKALEENPNLVEELEQLLAKADSNKKE